MFHATNSAALLFPYPAGEMAAGLHSENMFCIDSYSFPVVPNDLPTDRGGSLYISAEASPRVHALIYRGHKSLVA